MGRADGTNRIIRSKHGGDGDDTEAVCPGRLYMADGRLYEWRRSYDEYT